MADNSYFTNYLQKKQLGIISTDKDTAFYLEPLKRKRSNNIENVLAENIPLSLMPYSRTDTNLDVQTLLDDDSWLDSSGSEPSKKDGKTFFELYPETNLQFYKKLILEPIKNGLSDPKVWCRYDESITDSSENVMENSINFGWNEKDDSYLPVLGYADVSVNYMNSSPLFWIFDNDEGIITLFGTNIPIKIIAYPAARTQANSIYFSFFKYVGDFGFNNTKITNSLTIDKAGFSFNKSNIEIEQNNNNLLEVREIKETETTTVDVSSAVYKWDKEIDAFNDKSFSFNLLNNNIYVSYNNVDLNDNKFSFNTLINRDVISNANCFILDSFNDDTTSKYSNTYFSKYERRIDGNLNKIYNQRDTYALYNTDNVQPEHLNINFGTDSNGDYIEFYYENRKIGILLNGQNKTQGINANLIVDISRNGIDSSKIYFKKDDGNGNVKKSTQGSFKDIKTYIDGEYIIFNIYKPHFKIESGGTYYNHYFDISVNENKPITIQENGYDPNDSNTQDILTVSDIKYYRFNIKIHLSDINYLNTYISKYDLDGNLIKQINPSMALGYKSLVVEDIITDDNKNIYAGGYTYSDIDGINSNPQYSDLFILKYDENLSLVNKFQLISDQFGTYSSSYDLSNNEHNVRLKHKDNRIVFSFNSSSDLSNNELENGAITDGIYTFDIHDSLIAPLTIDLRTLTGGYAYTSSSNYGIQIVVFNSDNTVTCSSYTGGMEISQYFQVVDGNTEHTISIAIKNLVTSSATASIGKNKFYCGVVSYDSNFTKIGSTRYGVARAFQVTYDVIPQNTTKTFTGTFKGFNVSGDSDPSHNKFEPGAVYFRIIIYCNYSGGNQNRVQIMNLSYIQKRVQNVLTYMVDETLLFKKDICNNVIQDMQFNGNKPYILVHNKEDSAKPIIMYEKSGNGAIEEFTLGNDTRDKLNSFIVSSGTLNVFIMVGTFYSNATDINIISTGKVIDQSETAETGVKSNVSNSINTINKALILTRKVDGTIFYNGFVYTPTDDGTVERAEYTDLTLNSTNDKIFVCGYKRVDGRNYPIVHQYNKQGSMIDVDNGIINKYESDEYFDTEFYKIKVDDSDNIYIYGSKKDLQADSDNVGKLNTFLFKMKFENVTNTTSIVKSKLVHTDLSGTELKTTKKEAKSVEVSEVLETLKTEWSQTQNNMNNSGFTTEAIDVDLKYKHGDDNSIHNFYKDNKGFNTPLTSGGNDYWAYRNKRFTVLYSLTNILTSKQTKLKFRIKNVYCEEGKTMFQIITDKGSVQNSRHTQQGGVDEPYHRLYIVEDCEPDTFFTEHEIYGKELNIQDYEYITDYNVSDFYKNKRIIEYEIKKPYTLFRNVIGQGDPYISDLSMNGIKMPFDLNVNGHHFWSCPFKIGTFGGYILNPKNINWYEGTNNSFIVRVAIDKNIPYIPKFHDLFKNYKMYVDGAVDSQNNVYTAMLRSLGSAKLFCMATDPYSYEQKGYHELGYSYYTWDDGDTRNYKPAGINVQDLSGTNLGRLAMISNVNSMIKNLSFNDITDSFTKKKPVFTNPFKNVKLEYVSGSTTIEFKIHTDEGSFVVADSGWASTADSSNNNTLNNTDDDNRLYLTKIKSLATIFKIANTDTDIIKTPNYVNQTIEYDLSGVYYTNNSNSDIYPRWPFYVTDQVYSYADDTVSRGKSLKLEVPWDFSNNAINIFTSNNNSYPSFLDYLEMQNKELQTINIRKYNSQGVLQQNKYIDLSGNVCNGIKMICNGNDNVDVAISGKKSIRDISYIDLKNNVLDYNSEVHIFRMNKSVFNNPNVILSTDSDISYIKHEWDQTNSLYHNKYILHIEGEMAQNGTSGWNINSSGPFDGSTSYFAKNYLHHDGELRMVLDGSSSLVIDTSDNGLTYEISHNLLTSIPHINYYDDIWRSYNPVFTSEDNIKFKNNINTAILNARSSSSSYNVSTSLYNLFEDYYSFDISKNSNTVFSDTHSGIYLFDNSSNEVIIWRQNYVDGTSVNPIENGGTAWKFHQNTVESNINNSILFKKRYQIDISGARLTPEKFYITNTLYPVYEIAGSYGVDDPFKIKLISLTQDIGETTLTDIAVVKLPIPSAYINFIDLQTRVSPSMIGNPAYFTGSSYTTTDELGNIGRLVPDGSGMSYNNDGIKFNDAGYFEITKNVNVNGGQTYETYIKTHTSGSYAASYPYETIFDTGLEQYSADEKPLLGLHYNTTTTPNKYEVIVKGSDNAAVGGDNSIPLELDTFYHIVWTFSSKKDFKIYVDGVFKTSGTITNNNHDFSDTASGYIHVGGDGSHSGQGYQSFVGIMKYAKYYDKELTQNEVESIYNSRGEPSAYNNLYILGSKNCKYNTHNKPITESKGFVLKVNGSTNALTKYDLPMTDVVNNGNTRIDNYPMSMALSANNKLYISGIKQHFGNNYTKYRLFKGQIQTSGLDSKLIQNAPLNNIFEYAYHNNWNFVSINHGGVDFTKTYDPIYQNITPSVYVNFIDLRTRLGLNTGSSNSLSSDYTTVDEMGNGVELKHEITGMYFTDDGLKFNDRGYLKVVKDVNVNSGTYEAYLKTESSGGWYNTIFNSALETSADKHKPQLALYGNGNSDSGGSGTFNGWEVIVYNSPQITAGGAGGAREVPVEANNWVHIVWTFSSKTDFKIYVNGEFKLSGNTNTGHQNTPTGNIFIGGTGSGNSYVGIMKYAKYYPRELNAIEVDQIYNIREMPNNNNPYTQNPQNIQNIQTAILYRHIDAVSIYKKENDDSWLFNNSDKSWSYQTHITSENVKITSNNDSVWETYFIGFNKPYHSDYNYDNVNMEQGLINKKSLYVEKYTTDLAIEKTWNTGYKNDNISGIENTDIKINSNNDVYVLGNIKNDQYFYDKYNLENIEDFNVFPNISKEYNGNDIYYGSIPNVNTNLKYIIMNGFNWDDAYRKVNDMGYRLPTYDEIKHLVNYNYYAKSYFHVPIVYNDDTRTNGHKYWIYLSLDIPNVYGEVATWWVGKLTLTNSGWMNENSNVDYKKIIFYVDDKNEKPNQIKAYLTKLNHNLDYVKTNTWYNSSTTHTKDLIIDNSNNLFVSGYGVDKYYSYNSFPKKDIDDNYYINKFNDNCELLNTWKNDDVRTYPSKILMDNNKLIIKGFSLDNSHNKIEYLKKLEIENIINKQYEERIVDVSLNENIKWNISIDKDSNLKMYSYDTEQNKLNNSLKLSKEGTITVSKGLTINNYDDVYTVVDKGTVEYKSKIATQNNQFEESEFSLVNESVTNSIMKVDSMGNIIKVSEILTNTFKDYFPDINLTFTNYNIGSPNNLIDLKNNIKSNKTPCSIVLDEKDFVVICNKTHYDEKINDPSFNAWNSEELISGTRYKHWIPYIFQGGPDYHKFTADRMIYNTTPYGYKDYIWNGKSTKTSYGSGIKYAYRNVTQDKDYNPFIDNTNTGNYFRISVWIKINFCKKRQNLYFGFNRTNGLFKKQHNNSETTSYRSYFHYCNIIKNDGTVMNPVGLNTGPSNYWGSFALYDAFNENNQGLYSKEYLDINKWFLFTGFIKKSDNSDAPGVKQWRGGIYDIYGKQYANISDVIFKSGWDSSNDNPYMLPLVLTSTTSKSVNLDYYIYNPRISKVNDNDYSINDLFIIKIPKPIIINKYDPNGKVIWSKYIYNNKLDKVHDFYFNNENDILLSCKNIDDKLTIFKINKEDNNVKNESNNEEHKLEGNYDYYFNIDISYNTYYLTDMKYNNEHNQLQYLLKLANNQEQLFKIDLSSNNLTVDSNGLLTDSNGLYIHSTVNNKLTSTKQIIRSKNDEILIYSLNENNNIISSTFGDISNPDQTLYARRGVNSMNLDYLNSHSNYDTKNWFEGCFDSNYHDKYNLNMDIVDSKNWDNPVTDVSDNVSGFNWQNTYEQDETILKTSTDWFGNNIRVMEQRNNGSYTNSGGIKLSYKIINTQERNDIIKRNFIYTCFFKMTGAHSRTSTNTSTYYSRFGFYNSDLVNGIGGGYTATTNMIYSLNNNDDLLDIRTLFFSKAISAQTSNQHHVYELGKWYMLVGFVFGKDYNGGSNALETTGAWKIVDDGNNNVSFTKDISDNELITFRNFKMNDNTTEIGMRFLVTAINNSAGGPKFELYNPNIIDFGHEDPASLSLSDIYNLSMKKNLTIERYDFKNNVLSNKKSLILYNDNQDKLIVADKYDNIYLLDKKVKIGNYYTTLEKYDHNFKKSWEKTILFNNLTQTVKNDLYEIQNLNITFDLQDNIYIYSYNSLTNEKIILKMDKNGIFINYKILDIDIGNYNYNNKFKQNKIISNDVFIDSSDNLIVNTNIGDNKDLYIPGNLYPNSIILDKYNFKDEGGLIGNEYKWNYMGLIEGTTENSSSDEGKYYGTYASTNKLVNGITPYGIKDHIWSATPGTGRTTNTSRDGGLFWNGSGDVINNFVKIKNNKQYRVSCWIKMEGNIDNTSGSLYFGISSKNTGANHNLRTRSNTWYDGGTNSENNRNSYFHYNNEWKTATSTAPENKVSENVWYSDNYSNTYRTSASTGSGKSSTNFGYLNSYRKGKWMLMVGYITPYTNGVLTNDVKGGIFDEQGNKFFISNGESPHQTKLTEFYTYSWSSSSGNIVNEVEIIPIVLISSYGVSPPNNNFLIYNPRIQEVEIGNFNIDDLLPKLHNVKINPNGITSLIKYKNTNIKEEEVTKKVNIKKVEKISSLDSSYNPVEKWEINIDNNKIHINVKEKIDDLKEHENKLLSLDNKGILDINNKIKTKTLNLKSVWSKSITNYENMTTNITCDNEGNVYVIYVSNSKNNILSNKTRSYTPFTFINDSYYNDASTFELSDRRTLLTFKKYAIHPYYSYIVKYDINGKYKWGKMISPTEFNDFINIITSDEYNNIYVAGYSEGDIMGGILSNRDKINKNIIVVKYDNNGEQIWGTQLNQNNYIDLTEDDILTDCKTDFNENVFVSFYQDNYYKNSLIVKYDKNGKFNNFINLSKPDCDFIINSLCLDKDDTLYFVGLNGKLMIIYKYTNNLKYVKHKTYPIHDNSENYLNQSMEAKQIKLDKNNNLIVSGIIKSNKNTDIIIIKLDSDLNELWIKKIGKIGIYEESVQIDIDDKNNIYITGSTSGNTIKSNSYGYENYYNDLFITKINENGIKINRWENQIGNKITNEGITGIIVDPYNNVYVSGYGNNIDIYSINKKVNNGFIVKFNENNGEQATDDYWHMKINEQKQLEIEYQNEDNENNNLVIDKNHNMYINSTKYFADEIHLRGLYLNNNLDRSGYEHNGKIVDVSTNEMFIYNKNNEYDYIDLSRNKTLNLSNSGILDEINTAKFSLSFQIKINTNHDNKWFQVFRIGSDILNDESKLYSDGIRLTGRTFSERIEFWFNYSELIDNVDNTKTNKYSIYYTYDFDREYLKYRKWYNITLIVNLYEKRMEDKHKFYLNGELIDTSYEKMSGNKLIDTSSIEKYKNSINTLIIGHGIEGSGKMAEIGDYRDVHYHMRNIMVFDKILTNEEINNIYKSSRLKYWLNVEYNNISNSILLPQHEFKYANGGDEIDIYKDYPASGEGGVQDIWFDKGIYRSKLMHKLETEYVRSWRHNRFQINPETGYKYDVINNEFTAFMRIQINLQNRADMSGVPWSGDRKYFPIYDLVNLDFPQIKGFQEILYFYPELNRGTFTGYEYESVDNLRFYFKRFYDNSNNETTSFDRYKDVFLTNGQNSNFINNGFFDCYLSIHSFDDYIKVDIYDRKGLTKINIVDYDSKIQSDLSGDDITEIMNLRKRPERCYVTFGTQYIRNWELVNSYTYETWRNVGSSIVPTIQNTNDSGYTHTNTWFGFNGFISNIMIISDDITELEIKYLIYQNDYNLLHEDVFNNNILYKTPFPSFKWVNKVLVNKEKEKKAHNFSNINSDKRLKIHSNDLSELYLKSDGIGNGIYHNLVVMETNDTPYRGMGVITYSEKTGDRMFYGNNYNDTNMAFNIGFDIVSKDGLYDQMTNNVFSLKNLSDNMMELRIGDENKQINQIYFGDDTRCWIVGIKNFVDDINLNGTISKNMISFGVSDPNSNGTNPQLRISDNYVLVGGNYNVGGSGGGDISNPRNVNFEVKGKSFFYGDVDISGNVGIGTNSPGYPLEINGLTETDGINGNYFNNGSLSIQQISSSVSISTKLSNGIWSGGVFISSSDQRIKENIVEVPDNLSLQKLRDINCTYYEYKDKISRGNDKTIGFIAQQVKEHMPMAVSMEKSIIPNEMRKIENPDWTPITENGETKYKLTISDLSDNVGNTKYRFYVSNDPSGNDEVQKEIKSEIDDPKSFVFDQSWTNVFLYGKKVDDFHILDKNKLFALNFSATQEIDRIQQAAEAKITALQNENAELKTKNTELENKYTALEARIAALEN